MNEEKFLIAGFGGQGVMMIGQLLAYCGNKKGYNSLWLPSYGPETRGGTANCSVIVSKEAIYSPIFMEACNVFVLNQPSLDRFISSVKNDGHLFYNSSLITSVPNLKTIKILGIPINELAMQLGNTKVANIVLLGAYLATSTLFTMDEMIATLKDYLSDDKSKYFAINVEALKLGYQYAKEHYQC